MGLQAPHSPVEANIHSLHTLVTWLMVLVVLFVAGLLGYVDLEVRRQAPTQTPAALATTRYWKSPGRCCRC